MSMYVEAINDLFRECKTYENRRKKRGKKTSARTVESTVEQNQNKNIQCNSFRNINNEIFKSNDESEEKLCMDIERIFFDNKIRSASNEFSSSSKMMAALRFAAGDEISAIGYLIDSHAVILQQHIFHRYTKSLLRRKYLNHEQSSGLKPIYTKFDLKSTKGEHSLPEKLAQMPEEWYMVQVTVAYKRPHILQDSILDSVVPLHITILPTGKKAIQPFCITVPKPKYDEYHNYDGLKEVVDILKNNKSQLESYYGNNQSYWKMREKQNNRMKIAVKELEYSWLREWRILLMADPVEDSLQVKEIKEMIDKLIADDLSVTEISSRSKWLLKKIATCAYVLTKTEIARAVCHVLPKNEKLAHNVILSIHGILNTTQYLKTEKRKTLVMIVDECIDHVPFETMDVLQCHPVTRFPSLHVAFAMFKEHEDSIVDGCKIIKSSEEFGTFIINPARNLDKMEKRMKLFVNYWLPHWKGKYGCEPNEDEYEKMLVSKDVLMYSGHGSGIQYLPGEKIERLRVQATVLLFGCSSVKLFSTGGRFPPYGISNQYLIACSPCVLGMLWEVTDGDIDRMTARFMSDWIPSVEKKSWANVDISKWCNGVLKFKDSNSESTSERELLRAVANSKEACTQHMTSAAIIVRGLPIRLE